MIFKKEVGESLTLKFAEFAKQRRAEGGEIISLGLGEPDFETPKEIVQATIDALNENNSGYSSPMGLEKLRSLISDKLRIYNSIPANKNNILITPGAKQALQFSLMCLLQPGDEVIVINPSFVSFIPQIYLAEPNAVLKVIDVNKKDFSLPLEKIEDTVSEKTKVLILNSPNNPSGYLLSPEQLKFIYELAEKYNFYIISDEVYEGLIFPGEKHVSIGSLENSINRVFTINGYSKSHSMTGWRLGYVCFPSKFELKLIKLQQHINTNTCTFVQQGMIKAHNIDMNYLKEYNEKLSERVKVVHDKVKCIPGISLTMPKAGFFSFINIQKLGSDSNTFCGRLLLEQGVATTPGIAFGENWDDHFRLSYAVEDNLLMEGLNLIEEFVRKNYS